MESTNAIYGLHLGDHDYRYVGKSTAKVKYRFRKHLQEALDRKTKMPVHDWIRKHGAENIYCDVLDHADDKFALIDLEREWISRLLESGYRLLNVKFGGPDNTGHKMSADARAKMSRARLGRKTGVSMSGEKNGMWGKRHSAEQRAKWSRERRGDGLNGAKMSESTVMEMRSLYRFGFSVPMIAKIYGHSVGSVGAALAGSTWSHLPGGGVIRRSKWFYYAEHPEFYPHIKWRPPGESKRRGNPSG